MSDLETLTVLNRDYIYSVQHGDERRFQEILAEDFLCSNPDGSLVDKPRFLDQTARPVTISGLEGRPNTTAGRFRHHPRAPATEHRRASRATAATPTCGRTVTDAGFASRRT